MWRNVTGRKRWGKDVIAHVESRAEQLWPRREDSDASPEEEDGARGAGPAHGTLTGAALEDRTRPPVPDPADAAAYRPRIQRGPGVLLRGLPREAADCGGAEGGSTATS